jgi:hypothetical protein
VQTVKLGDRLTICGLRADISLWEGWYPPPAEIPGYPGLPPSKKAVGPPDHRVPLVLGTSSIEGSTATAARSALENALNAASQMWWSFLPVTVM